MTLKQIAGLGRKLVAFLRLFSDCFGRSEPRELLRAYVKGQLSNLKRKNVEAIALQLPLRRLRALQRQSSRRRARRRDGKRVCDNHWRFVAASQQFRT